MPDTISKSHVIKRLGDTIKAVDDDTFSGYGVVFSNPETPDLEDDYFDHTTYFWPDIPTSVVIYDHALGLHPDAIQQDGSLSDVPVSPQRFRIGKVTKRVQDDRGIYIEFKMTPTMAVYNNRLKTWEELVDQEHQEWLELVKGKLKDGTFNFSSDSMSHLVEREYMPDKGVYHLKSWPLPAISITPRAAEPRAQIASMKAAAGNAKATASQAERDVSAATTTDSRQRKTIMRVKRKARKENGDADMPVLEEVLEDVQDAVEEILEEIVENGDVKQSEGEIEALLRPVADQIAELTGAATDEVLPDLLSLVMARLVPAVEELVEEAVVEEEATAMYDDDEEGGFMVEQKRIRRNRKALANALASYAKPRGAAVLNGSGHYKTVNYNRRDPDKNPHKMGALVKSLLGSKMGDPRATQRLHQLHAEATKAYKAQGTNPDSAGGFLVVPERTGEVIESIKAEAVVAPMLRQRPMTSNVLEVPRVQKSATVSGVAENARIPDTEVELDMERAYAIKLGAILKFSDEIRSYSEEDAEEVFRDELVREVPVELDRQILYGSGVGNQLLGLENRPLKTAATRGITVTSLSSGLAYTDLTQMQERLEDTDLTLNDSVRWLIDPKGKRIIREVEDSSGRLIFTAGGEGTQLAGAPPSYILDYQWTMSNLLVASPKPAARKLYLCKWDEIYLGIAKQLEIRLSDEAGESFERDQIWIRAITRVAMLVRQPEAIHILDNITAAATA